MWVKPKQNQDVLRKGFHEQESLDEKFVLAQKSLRREENVDERVYVRGKWPYSAMKSILMKFFKCSHSLEVWQNSYSLETTQGNKAKYPLGRGECTKALGTSVETGLRMTLP